jgi:hypothetical protein
MQSSAYFLCGFNETFTLSTDFIKNSQHENPSSWSRVIPFGRTDGRTYMTKLMADVRSFI